MEGIEAVLDHDISTLRPRLKELEESDKTKTEEIEKLEQDNISLVEANKSLEDTNLDLREQIVKLEEALVMSRNELQQAIAKTAPVIGEEVSSEEDVQLVQSETRYQTKKEDTPPDEFYQGSCAKQLGMEMACFGRNVEEMVIYNSL